MMLWWEVSKFIIFHPLWTALIIVLILLALIGLAVNGVKSLRPSALGLTTTGQEKRGGKSLWSTVGVILIAIGCIGGLGCLVWAWIKLVRLEATAGEINGHGHRLVGVLREKRSQVPEYLQIINDRLASEHLRLLKQGSDAAIESLQRAYLEGQTTFDRHLEQPLGNIKRILDELSQLSTGLQDWIENWRPYKHSYGLVVAWKQFDQCQKQAQQALKWLNEGYDAFRVVVKEARDALPKLGQGKRERLGAGLLTHLVQQVVKDSHYLKDNYDLDARLEEAQRHVEQTSGVLLKTIRMRRWILTACGILCVMTALLAAYFDRARLPRLAIACLMSLIPVALITLWLLLAHKAELKLVGRLRRQESFSLAEGLDSSILWQQPIKLGKLPAGEIKTKLKAFHASLKQDDSNLISNTLRSLQQAAHGCDEQAQRHFSHPPLGWRSFLQQTRPILESEWDYLLNNYGILYRGDRGRQRYPVQWELATAVRDNLSWMERGVESTRRMAMRALGEACGGEERALAEISQRGISVEGEAPNPEPLIKELQIALEPLLDGSRVQDILNQIYRQIDPLYNQLEQAQWPLMAVLLIQLLLLIAILILLRLPALIWDGFKCLLGCICPCLGLPALLRSLCCK